MDQLKEYIKSIIRKQLSEESSTGDIGVGAGPIMTPRAFIPKGQKKNKATKTAEKLGFKIAKNKNSMLKEALNEIIEQELINEVSYNKFKNEVKYRTKAEQLHKAIREVKRKLQEIDRIVEYTQRMKQELSEGDGIQYWNRTNKAVATISEMINHLNNKIKSLNQ